MHVRMLVEERSCPVEKGHRAKSSLPWCSGTVLTDGGVDRPHEHPQHAAEDALVVLKEVADALGNGEHPLPDRDARDDVVNR